MGETTTERTLESVLNDGCWHPILAPGEVDTYVSKTYWVSEAPQEPRGEEVDHSGAEAFRVDFEPLRWRWARDPAEGMALGRTALLPEPPLIDLLVVKGMGYIRLYGGKREDSQPAAAAAGHTKIMTRS
jgi:hypothetical protein